MGCENSQVTDITPHEVQQLPPDNYPEVKTPNKPASKLTPNNQKNLPDKENSRPQETPSKKSIKERHDSRKVSELKKQSVKSECQLEQKPAIVETTNLPKENLVLEENSANKRTSQHLSARAIEKPEEDPVGPSSKSIEAPPATPSNTGVESFPISNVLEEEKKEQQVSVRVEQKSEKEAHVEKGHPQEAEERVGTPESQRIVMTQFSLDQFEKTQRGKEVESEEVEKYLQDLWSYETVVLDALIDRLEEREKLRYQEGAC